MSVHWREGDGPCTCARWISRLGCSTGCTRCLESLVIPGKAAKVVVANGSREGIGACSPLPLQHVFEKRGFATLMSAAAEVVSYTGCSGR